MIIIRYSLVVACVPDDFGAMFHINTSRLEIGWLYNSIIGPRGSLDSILLSSHSSASLLAHRVLATCLFPMVLLAANVSFFCDGSFHPHSSPRRCECMFIHHIIFTSLHVALSNFLLGYCYYLHGHAG